MQQEFCKCKSFSVKTALPDATLTSVMSITVTGLASGTVSMLSFVDIEGHLRSEDVHLLQMVHHLFNYSFIFYFIINYLLQIVP